MKSLVIAALALSITGIALAENPYVFKPTKKLVVVNMFGNTQLSNGDSQSQIDNLIEQRNEKMSRNVVDEDVSVFFNDKTVKGSGLWRYTPSIDEVEQDVTTESILKSANSFDLGVGHGGRQNLFITIDNVHDTGFYNDSIRLGYNKGLVDVCLGDCYMRARFDDENEAKTYRLSRLDSHTYKLVSAYGLTNNIEYDGVRLKDDDYFLLKLYNAKSLVLNFPTFGEEVYTYKFDLKGLDVDKMGSK